MEPFLFKFWELIDRVDREKCTFDEFLPACCAFSLFTRADMISFIFNLLDRDNDAALCKVDLLKFSALSRVGRKDPSKIIRLYPTNVNLSIDMYKFTRGDQIDIEEFTQCVHQIPYFAYPAFRLQDQIQEYFGGFALWKRAKQKIEDQEKEDKIQKLKEQFLKRKQEREKEIYDKLMDKYNIKLEEYNKAYYRRQKIMR